MFRTLTLTVIAATAPVLAISLSAPAHADTIPGEGTYRVGVDISPGTYKSLGTTSSACSWTTHSSMASNGNEIDGNASFGGQLYADIPATAVMFETHGCLPWVKVSR